MLVADTKVTLASNDSLKMHLALTFAADGYSTIKSRPSVALMLTKKMFVAVYFRYFTCVSHFVEKAVCQNVLYPDIDSFYGKVETLPSTVFLSTYRLPFVGIKSLWLVVTYNGNTLP